MHPLDAYLNETLPIHRQGRLEEAELRYRDMLARDARYPRAWHLLGVVLHQRGESLAAVDCIRHAATLHAADPTYHFNLGVVLRALGRWVEAADALRQSLALNPRQPEALCQLGSTLTQLCQVDEARRCFASVLALARDHVDALVGLAHCHGELNEPEKARACLLEACRLRPSPHLRVLAATQLPCVYASRQDLQDWRDRFTRDVDQLLAEGVCADVTAIPATPVFTLAHQGFNDVDLQRKLARLYRPPPPGVPPIPPAGARGKIRAGFVSSFFRDHTIGKLLRGVIEGLDRREFSVAVFSVGLFDDAVARAIRSAADHFAPLTIDLAYCRRVIAEAGVDVLVYPEVGMDPTTYTLALSRLAPVQCVTWGHPDTTGMETVDYFLSSRLLETPESPGHYSEKLVAFAGLNFCYGRPALPEAWKGRADFGLEERARLYVCPQSIYKFHPDFDPLLAEILRRDPEGRLVLIRWIYPEVDERLFDRWRRTMPDLLGQVRLVPRLGQEDFFRLLAVSDVMLDPTPFGGGNTSWEAFALGLPVVTLPGRFLRGRVTAALYRQMGFPDLVADTPERYVNLALQLAADAAYRQTCRERILSAGDRLFDDRQPIREFEDFLRGVAAGRPLA